MAYLEKFRASSANRWLQRILRVLQFLSSVISFGFFTARLARLLQLARTSYTRGDGAVEGILAAAVLYTTIVMLSRICCKAGGPKPLRWLLILLDILFIGGFIAIAALTSPHGGSAGPNSGDCGRSRDSFVGGLIPQNYRNEHNCNLPWGTFILAIISTVLHFLTAVFHEIHDHRQKHKDAREHKDSHSSHI